MINLPTGEAVEPPLALTDDASSLDFLNVAEVVERETTTLKPGDFYVTRHSNLANVHTVFHMAVNDSGEGFFRTMSQDV